MTTPSRAKTAHAHLEDRTLDLLCRQWTPQDRTRIRTTRRHRADNKTVRLNAIWDAIRQELHTIPPLEALHQGS